MEEMTWAVSRWRMGLWSCGANCAFQCATLGCASRSRRQQSSSAGASTSSSKAAATDSKSCSQQAAVAAVVIVSGVTTMTTYIYEGLGHIKLPQAFHVFNDPCPPHTSPPHFYADDAPLQLVPSLPPSAPSSSSYAPLKMNTTPHPHSSNAINYSPLGLLHIAPVNGKATKSKAVGLKKNEKEGA